MAHTEVRIPWETLQAFTDVHDCPSRGIAQRHRLVQSVECCLNRGENTFAASFVEHLADQVGA